MPTGRIVRSPARISYNRLLLDCPVGNSTVMYDVARLGKFEVPNIRKRNDDALWLRMLRTEPFIWGMPVVLMRYRLRSGSVSANKRSLVKYHWTLYRDIEHLSVPPLRLPHRRVGPHQDPQGEMRTGVSRTSSSPDRSGPTEADRQ